MAPNPISEPQNNGTNRLVLTAQNALLALNDPASRQPRITRSMSRHLPQGTNQSQDLSTESYQREESDIVPTPKNLHLSSPAPLLAVPTKLPAIVDKSTTSPLVDVGLYWEIYSRHARVLLESEGRDKVYNVQVLMKDLPAFFGWYTVEASLTIATPVLEIELLNNNRQVIQGFRIYRGAFTYFKSVKQNIWNTFWEFFNNGQSGFLNIYVRVPKDGPGYIGGEDPTARYSLRHESTIRKVLN
jgi:hypothetical protein